MKSEIPLQPKETGQTGRERASDLALLAAGEPPYRSLFDGLPGMVYLAHGDPARTVELASAGSHALLGFQPGPKPFPLAPLIHPGDRDQVLDVVKNAIAENRAFAVEYRLRHAGGAWRTVWEQGRPLRRGAHPLVQGQLLDVTHRVQREQSRLEAELRLLHTQKFQTLNQLAGGVAHEFNNLIAGILGSAELLAMDLPANQADSETLKQIFEASNLARDFVHKLRVLGQRPLPEFKPFRLQSVIEECLQILHSIIPARVELQTRISPDCPRVNGDPAQIHQAILDLCLHAWQTLADRQGHIIIALEYCAAVHPPAGATTLLQPGPHVCLTIQDSSPVLDKNAREHIFHPFRNRRLSGKKVGLELFLVRETIQSHQGEIFFDSEAGHGQIFRIYLPAAAEK
jgi:nitrogen-specific signal transduction histidine kinase